MMKAMISQPMAGKTDGEIVEDCEGYRVTGTFNCCPKCGREVVSE